MPPDLSFADLEIRILDEQEEGFPVEITLDNEREFPRRYLDPAIVSWTGTADPETDGRRLYDFLFTNDQPKSAWNSWPCPSKPAPSPWRA